MSSIRDGSGESCALPLSPRCAKRSQLSTEQKTGLGLLTFYVFWRFFMPKPDPRAQQLIRDLAQRHAVSEDAVMSLFRTLSATGGANAQFNHSEFGGCGQWMQGGMTPVDDMFNSIHRGAPEPGLGQGLAELGQSGRSASSRVRICEAIQRVWCTRRRFGGALASPASRSCFGLLEMFEGALDGTAR
jgi:hypothetical protein